MGRYSAVKGLKSRLARNLGAASRCGARPHTVDLQARSTRIVKLCRNCGRMYVWNVGDQDYEEMSVARGTHLPSAYGCVRCDEKMVTAVVDYLRNLPDASEVLRRGEVTAADIVRVFPGVSGPRALRLIKWCAEKDGYMAKSEKEMKECR